ncbi:PorP/SprF family type IX secretion system membrane protein [Aquirufa ecclesiirivi]|uniref:PorP/SprF family type IX secretion system membrane protein n=1 Tax=Aquirufa ecclesiirivi TaxID=2715124 RepID=UPI0023D86803|nr:PorP/SprF family type IX secretion system membrane protein [Aquirufa ecclesiirivi]MDF0694310.1 PorP/SprF family type IX secretion system membrane protein [Aquirufa ecclesiirivi]
MRFNKLSLILPSWIFVCFGIGLFFWSPSMLAQQDPGLSMFQLNAINQNPANAGLRGASFAQLHYRNQWTQYEASIEGPGNLGTQLLSVSLPISKLNLGVGLLVMSDKTPSGVGQQAMKIQLAYHYTIGEAIFSVGLRGGLQSKSFDGRAYRIRDDNDPIASQLSGKVISQNQFDLGLGLLYSKDNWQIGLSADHLTSPKFTLDTPQGNMPVNLVAALYGSAEIVLSENLAAMPFAQVRYYSNRILPEVGSRFGYKDLFWLGASYRLNDAAIGMAGVSLLQQRLDIGYSLDVSMVQAAVKAPLTHEIFVRFQLPSFQSNGIKGLPVRTPRFKIL